MSCWLWDDSEDQLSRLAWPGPQRVPRSQISRAHPAAAAGAYGERTSAVLSALSGDDETALSAAEAAGEHTSEPQEAVGGVGEAHGAAPVASGAGAAGRSGIMGAAPAPPHQQMPALSLTAPAPRGRGGFELASSPPVSTSPIYRANSVVSYTAGPPSGKHGTQQTQQVMGPPRRGAETPASAPAAAQVLGSSPNTSRGEVGGARWPARNTTTAPRLATCRASGTLVAPACSRAVPLLLAQLAACR